MPKKSSLAILFVCVFVDLLGFGILLPVLPTYARGLGASDFEVGLLFTVFSLMQFLVGPVWGRISDRVGRRPILIAMAIGSTIAFTIFGVADALWFLFVARAFAGMCFSVPTAQAYVADVTAPEERAKGMALLGAAFGLGFTVGPGLAGLAAHFWGVRAPFFIAAGLTLSNTIAMTFLLPEPERRVSSGASGMGSLGDALRMPRLAFWLGVFFVIVYAFSHIEATFILWNHDELGFDERDNGLVFMYVGLVLTLTQALLVRRLVGRLGEVRLIVIGTVMIAVSSAVIPWMQSWWTLAIVITFMAAGNALNNPSITSAISRSAPVERQGEMLGVAQSVGALGRMAGPAAGTYLYGHAGHAWPYFTTAALVMATACVVIARRAASTGTPTGL